ncbi:hypothetical protein E2C01_080154 [Portunus trituberculatus]|uniref:Uncharacterized protein n=1 Tax=Portunus trituberculatus TaxID=210409 RepID=A0A5B7ISN9_PORTR|nr:hypothetical protein [Portunus trituberculatus]
MRADSQQSVTQQLTGSLRWHQYHQMPQHRHITRPLVRGGAELTPLGTLRPASLHLKAFNNTQCPEDPEGGGYALGGTRKWH